MTDKQIIQIKNNETQRKYKENIMSFLSLIIFAIIQGITEFLPISSTAHLQLIGKVMNMQTPEILEVAVHFGSVFAVIIYFREDVLKLALALWHFLRGKHDDNRGLLGLIIIASLPIFAIGGLFDLFSVDLAWRSSLKLIGWATLLFGILLYFSDKIGLTIRRSEHLTWKDALFIGFFQCLAIIPGVSRSGITMTAGRFAGMERTEVARFSMLISIPVILAAGLKSGLDVALAGDFKMTFSVILAAILSFAVALTVILALMQWVSRSSFLPFVIYRLILGVIVLLVAYLG